MVQYNSYQDTIAAIATASGTGGVAIVRLSGPRSVEVLGRVFSPRSEIFPFEWKPNVLHYGWVRDASGATIDEALAVVMRAPKSYTAEDSAEIHAHGGRAAARLALERCLEAGARLAEPGEFTRRAFMNGRIDLAQAEAVLDTVSARTELMLRAAQRQLDGGLSRELYSIRELLMGVYSGIEALLNFPEDDTDRGQAAAAREGVLQAIGRMEVLLKTARAGAVLRDGIKIVICGKPNSGKSSLLNALLKRPRAIVTDVAGTTRDTLEESAELNGVPVDLVDTAGILEPRDKVEEEAVRRSRDSIAFADIVVVVLDRSVPLEAVDRDLLVKQGCAGTVVVLNKSDLPSVVTAADVMFLVPGRPVAQVSAFTLDGVADLEDMLVEFALKGVLPDMNAVVLTNARHVEALRLALDFLGNSLEALDTGAPFEIVSDGIKSAVNRLDAVTGKDIDADALDRIFSGFCIGK